MLDHPRVTVIMPTWNAERHVAEAVDSVMRQTCQSWELLVMDAESTDATVDIVNAYDSRRIRVYSEADEGVAHAWDRAVDRARGDYVLLLCSSDAYTDDTWLETCVREMDADPELSLAWGLPSVANADGGNPQPHGLHPDEIARTQKRSWLLLWLTTGRECPDPTMCVARRVLRECLPQYREGSGVMCAVYEFLFEFNARGYLALGVPRVVSFSRVHEGQLSAGDALTAQRRWTLIDYARRIRRYRRALLQGDIVHTFRNRAGQPLDALPELSAAPEHLFHVPTPTGERMDLLEGANFADKVANHATRFVDPT